MTAKKANKTLRRIKILLILAMITVLFGLVALRYGDKISEFIHMVANNNVQIGDTNDKNTDKPDDSKTPDEGNNEDIVVPPLPTEPNYSQICKTANRSISESNIVTKLSLPHGSEILWTEFMNEKSYILVKSTFNYTSDKVSAETYISVIVMNKECLPISFFTLPDSANMTFCAMFPNNNGYMLLLNNNKNTIFYSLFDDMILHTEYKSQLFSSVKVVQGLDFITLYCTPTVSIGEAVRLHILNFSNDGVRISDTSLPVPKHSKTESVFAYNGSTYIRLSGEHSDSLVVLDNLLRPKKTLNYDKIFNVIPNFSNGFRLILHVKIGQEYKINVLDINYDCVTDSILNLSGNNKAIDHGMQTYFYDENAEVISMYKNDNEDNFLTENIGLDFDCHFILKGKYTFVTKKGDEIFSIDSSGVFEKKQLADSLIIKNPLFAQYKNGLYFTSAETDGGLYVMTFAYCVI